MQEIPTATDIRAYETVALFGRLRDDTATFNCLFLPLPLMQPPADGQDAWLDHIDPHWTTVTGDSQ
ncbi:hypothetical protein ACFZDK_55305 [Streptomyces sp. NPDC007901]|uniref:hypothetical protein n=1 Tax=Streptomyces sp. NPDC007901 TaxID=3364785 RepID=UPI0036E96833